MAALLYYSKYCNECNKLLKVISKNNNHKDMHFLCVDRREIINDKTYITLENKLKVLLPNNIYTVPSLLLLKEKRLLLGDKIYEYIKPKVEYIQKITNNNMIPIEYSNSEMGSCSLSDNYSYLDQTDEEMSAKGNGGLRQIHSFATINHEDKIETPPDDYVPDKLKDVDYNKFMENRANELK